MALRSRTTQRSLHVNLFADFTKQDKLAGAQSGRSDVGSDKAPTLPKAPTPLLIPPPAKDFFTKFMKVFMMTTQAQALAEP